MPVESYWKTMLVAGMSCFPRWGCIGVLSSVACVNRETGRFVRLHARRLEVNRGETHNSSAANGLGVNITWYDNPIYTQIW